jgi:hypothetical protein
MAVERPDQALVEALLPVLRRDVAQDAEANDKRERRRRTAGEAGRRPPPPSYS